MKTTAMKREDVGFFDRNEGWSVIERGLPHWTQAGSLCFVTWRANDSLPNSVLDRLDREIAEVLRTEGIDRDGDWKTAFARRSPAQRGRVPWKLFEARDRYLDQGYGACLLGQSKLSAIVESSLRKFDEDRYFLTDCVVMPNHAHFIAAFPEEAAMMKQCTEWKRFTARGINEQAERSGEFWQIDQFDHLIRSVEQFEHYRRYIADNPRRAGLQRGEYRHYQKELRSSHVGESLRDSH